MDPPKIKGRGTIDARVIKDNKSQKGGGKEYRASRFLSSDRILK